MSPLLLRPADNVGSHNTTCICLCRKSGEVEEYSTVTVPNEPFTWDEEGRLNHIQTSANSSFTIFFGGNLRLDSFVNRFIVNDRKWWQAGTCTHGDLSWTSSVVTAANLSPFCEIVVLNEKCPPQHIKKIQQEWGRNDCLSKCLSAFILFWPL